jgi:hypothetical protein
MKKIYLLSALMFTTTLAFATDIKTNTQAVDNSTQGTKIEFMADKEMSNVVGGYSRSGSQRQRFTAGSMSCSVYDHASRTIRPCK